MITVAILINGHPLVARAAVSTMGKDFRGKTMYRLDDGSWIAHDPKDGAVALAKLMLDTIKLEDATNVG